MRRWLRLSLFCLLLSLLSLALADQQAERSLSQTPPESRLVRSAGTAGGGQGEGDEELKAVVFEGGMGALLNFELRRGWDNL